MHEIDRHGGVARRRCRPWRTPARVEFSGVTSRSTIGPHLPPLRWAGSKLRLWPSRRSV